MSEHTRPIDMLESEMNARLDAANARIAELEGKLQHRAKQVIEMDRQMGNLVQTLNVLRKLPEVERFMGQIGDLAKMIADHKRAYKGGGEG